jgi:hypothetical protein
MYRDSTHPIRRRLGGVASAALVGLALTLSGCAASEPAPTAEPAPATQSATPTEQPQEIPEIPEPTVTDPAVLEEAFDIQFARDYPEFDLDTARSQALYFCFEIDSLGLETAVKNFEELVVPAFGQEIASAIAGSGVAAFCPQHVDALVALIAAG